MTAIDNHDQESKTGDRQAELSAFLSSLHDIVQRHAGMSGVSILELDDNAKQVLLDRINPYVGFELSQTPNVKGMRIKAQGMGVMYISSLEDHVLGAETISQGDVVEGILDDVCVYPVSTTECLLLGDTSGVPIVDELLSGVVMLKNATYKTGLNKEGEFEIEHDLGRFHIGLPLAHYLRFGTE